MTAAGRRSVLGPEGLALLLLVVTPLFFAANQLTARIVDGAVPPITLAVGRWSCTFLILLPMVGRPLWAARAELAREAGRLLVLGGFGMGLCGAPIYIAGQTTTATNMGLIYALSPVMILALTAAIWRYRVTARQGVGSVLALIGVMVIVGKGDPDRLLSLSFIPGDLWTLLSTLSWSFYSVLLRYWPSRLPLLVRFAAIVLAGVMVTLPCAILELAVADWPRLAPSAFGYMGFLGLVPGFCAYGCYGKLVALKGPAWAGLMLYLGPLYNGALGYLLLGEQPGFYHLWGCLLILPGLYLSTARRGAGS
ncbi:MAG TPA: DMT family transporter [Aliidongia sp.]|uniref:DMT family transporter n=1 Tax=Aliidongia sp. TaxID=1914230 RepID=UPI002DDD9ACF|nr:DMT family transporter [Aliidongia sp.]HEV2674335.1 DMT family transporter [Aliidongia sp.]